VSAGNTEWLLLFREIMVVFCKIRTGRCMYIYIYIYICVCVCMYVYIYIYIYVTRCFRNCGFLMLLQLAHIVNISPYKFKETVQ
jgi:hypothetical protein